MDAIGFEALVVLTILLPGFLAALVLSALAVRKERSQLEKVIEALVFSFVLYALWTWLILGRPLTVSAERVDDRVTRYSISFQPGELLWLFLLAVVLGLAMSFLVTNDIPTKVLRAVKITHASTRSSVWSDVFIDIKRYALVEFSDGRRILGWPRYISDTPEEATLFLERASWVLDDGSEVPIAGPGILVTKNMIIQTVSFLDPVPLQGQAADEEKAKN